MKRRLLHVGLVMLSLLAVGCGHSAVEPALHADHAPRTSLRYSVDPEIPQCRGQNDFFNLLSDSAKQVIDVQGKYSLQVDITRESEKGKRIRVELLKGEGSSVDTIVKSVGEHMDCPRVERLAATMASSLAEQATSKQSGQGTRVLSPVLRSEREYARLSPDKPIRNRISPVLRPSEHQHESPTRSAPEPERLRPSIKESEPEKEPRYVPPPFPSTQVSSSRVTTEQVHTTTSEQHVVVHITGDKPPEPSLSKGRYWSVGVGVLRGHDPFLYGAVRLGGGYSFGPVTFEGDFSFANAAYDVAANQLPGGWLYAVIVNAGMCGRSSAFGMCLLGSVMHDGYRDKLPAAPNLDASTAGDLARDAKSTKLSDFQFGGAFGASVRGWWDVPANGSWALRSSFELTIPIFLDSDSPNRLWHGFSPTASGFLSFVRAM